MGGQRIQMHIFLHDSDDTFKKLSDLLDIASADGWKINYPPKDGMPEYESKRGYLSRLRAEYPDWYDSPVIIFKGHSTGAYISTVKNGGENGILFGFSVQLNTDDPTYEETIAEFDNLVVKSVRKLRPVYARAGSEYSYPFFEFHSDPYCFATNVASEDGSSAYGLGPYRVLFNSRIFKHEVNEAKRLLENKELVEIIRKNVFEHSESGKGIGVWREKRTETGFNMNKFAYPTFFIRNELLRRGAKLYFGPTEESIIYELAFGPEWALEAGVISPSTAKRLDKLPTPRSKDTEKRVLKLLTKEEKHELGLDLPKPPEWMLKPEGGN